MKKYLFLTAVLLLMASPAHALFINGGFESGDTTGWTITGDHSVITSYTPQFINDVGWSSGIPYYGSYSLLLGSPNIGNEWDAGHSSSATQTGSISQADIDAGAHLYFKWGAILEEPTNNVYHGSSSQPYFSVGISKWNGSGWDILYYDDQRADEAGFTKIGHSASGDAGDMWYGSAITDIDLTSLALADQIKIDLYVRDCGLGGHGGLVFLDGFGTTNPNVIPEPTTMSLLGLGALGLIFRRKKRS